MKKLLILLFSIILFTCLFSCTSNDEVQYCDNTSTALEQLMIKGVQNVKLNINYSLENKKSRVVFDIYTENPYVTSSNNVIAIKDGVKPLITSMTDEYGAYQLSRVLPGNVKELYVSTKQAGLPILMKANISDGKANFKTTNLGNNKASRGDIEDNDVEVHEFVRSIQKLSSILPETKYDEKLSNLYVKTVSKVHVLNGYVSSVIDNMYIGNEDAINKMLESDNESSNIIGLDNIKSRDFMTIITRPSVSLITSDYGSSYLSADSIILETIQNNIDKINNINTNDSEPICLSIGYKFTPIKYSEFISTIPVGPFTPCIVKE